METGSWLNLFVALVFAIGVCTSRLAMRSIRKGHEYYHRTIYKKTLIEELLGLTTPVRDSPEATLAIGTTPGQAEINEILRDPNAWLTAHCTTSQPGRIGPGLVSNRSRYLPDRRVGHL